MKAQAFDGNPGLRFDATLSMSKQSAGRVCNKDGQGCRNRTTQRPAFQGLRSPKKHLMSSLCAQKAQAGAGCLRSFQRHAEGKDRALLARRAHLKRTSMSDGYLAGDVQAQSEPGLRLVGDGS
ncbi:hypothetical protein ALO42_102575 [Pseudomonas syringae pv. atrofaciens]|nr:hypothetical protein ALO42_102575 [Pseudomonas syringae pv. atrofaciens]